jgi:hypothetical protein
VKGSATATLQLNPQEHECTIFLHHALPNNESTLETQPKTHGIVHLLNYNINMSIELEGCIFKPNTLVKKLNMMQNII